MPAGTQRPERAGVTRGPRGTSPSRAQSGTSRTSSAMTSAPRKPTLRAPRSCSGTLRGRHRALHRRRRSVGSRPVFGTPPHLTLTRQSPLARELVYTADRRRPAAEDGGAAAEPADVDAEADDPVADVERALDRMGQSLRRARRTEPVAVHTPAPAPPPKPASDESLVLAVAELRDEVAQVRARAGQRAAAPRRG